MNERRPEILPLARPEWAYFLDVDGTLIELAETPDAVRVDADLPDFLERLFHACGRAVALVSGRALADLDQRLGHPDMPRAGQHGLERRDANGRVKLHARHAEAKCAIRAKLRAIVARHPLLLLEDKGLTMALHYRRAPRLGAYVHRAMREIVAASGGAFEFQTGKRVVEAKPVGFHKGAAVMEYLAEAPFKGRMPVFIGDDMNDEHAFAAVNAVGGLSIKVGRGRSRALYRLPDVASVRRWLGGVLEEGE